MGLFGFNQKDYDKNTALFHQYIELISNKCATNRGFIESAKNIDADSNMVSLLRTIDIALDHTEVIGKINWKQLESIDGNVLSFLNQLQQDLSKNKPAMFMAHLNMLSSVVNCRVACNDPRDDKTMKAEIKLQEMYALLIDVLKEKVSVETQMRALKEQAAKLDRSDPSVEILKAKFMGFASRLEALNVKKTEYTNTYNENLQIVNKVYDREDMYAELEDKDIETPQTISRRISELNRKSEQRMQRHEFFQEQFAELQSPAEVKQSFSFDDEVEAIRQANLEKGIDAADGLNWDNFGESDALKTKKSE